MDIPGVDKILQDTFGTVFDKYKVLTTPCPARHLWTVFDKYKVPIPWAKRTSSDPLPCICFLRIVLWCTSESAAMHAV